MPLNVGMNYGTFDTKRYSVNGYIIKSKYLRRLSRSPISSDAALVASILLFFCP